ncbi:hypothetical protein KQ302_08370 [Synechococcus sp. CS-602]|uniref:hypothetical protein n=1 Tax=Synechococcaceae TaxID=1890426 RepID=UPI0008FF0B60|nr:MULTISPECIES: hypothetical protein [Synechococcaceae]MCT4365254.1 hypothetical protein [Candidatus Regnicoccus frigidus MAG-AL1]APD48611.1 hypothetical protein BM449_10685 [Synechococcus sp. SynAce01]MCT0205107.1 hypothetical protein [Synechococcus sp. CS-602]MCT0245790.1 hypothetical protein [Synechococcus sp. CS-601]MCT4367363.1 hypothetical protein [Candidatus Regnicoccus frigidus MAG-AL2]
MLPAPPIPASRRQPLFVGAWISLVALVLLLLGLGGCQAAGQPPRQVLLDALELQIALTQDSIAQALELPPPGPPQVSRVRVEGQETVAIGEVKGLHLTGQFDWRLADAPYRVDSTFELFLQRGEKGQSWRLARPSEADGAQGWLIDSLPMKG